MAEAAQKIADKYCVSHKLIRLDGLLPRSDDPLKVPNYQQNVLGSIAASYAYDIGVWMFNITSGSIMTGALSIMPVILCVIGLSMYKLRSSIGESKVIDISVLILFGFLTSILANLNMFLIVYNTGILPKAAILTGIYWKTVFTTITPALGYPLVIAYKKFIGE